MGSLASFLIGMAARRSANRFEKAVRDPVATQNQRLQEILARNRETEYGREYGFAGIKNIEEYRKAVPLVTYEDIRDRIDRMTRGEKNVLTGEDPILFAQTSGTTGNPKYIPVTPTCQSAGGMTTWLHYARRDHPRMFRGKCLTVVSPAVEGHTESGLPYGSTSGMIVREMPSIVQSAYAVPYEAFEIEQYESKYYALLRLGLDANVTFLTTANPSTILKLAEVADQYSEMLIRDIRDGTLNSAMEISDHIRGVIKKRLRKSPQRARFLEKIRKARDGRLLPVDYWPQMCLLGCWKGGTVGAYIKRLHQWYDPDRKGMLPTRDMGYLASEARMSIPISDEGAGGVLTVHHNLFEFADAEKVENYPDDSSTWDFKNVRDLEIGREYFVFVTTTGGLYRYDINDVIEVVGKYRGTPLVVFKRKGRGMTNLTGEKVSVNQIIDAMDLSKSTTGMQVNHFRTEPDLDKSCYVFKVESDTEYPRDAWRTFLQTLDRQLGELNIEYRAKRASGRLGDPVLQVMKKGWYDRGKQALVADGKRAFQAKTVLLDSKLGYHSEPHETLIELTME